jgi:DNA polymerase III subunit delta
MRKNQAYYLWGGEDYLIDRKVESIIASITESSGEQPEVVWIDADELRPQELGQALEFSPLFALQRAVIIKKPVWLGKTTRKSRKIDESLQVLEDYWQNDHSGQVLIITSLEHNPANPVTKFLLKHAEVINIKNLSPKELEEWCKLELARRNTRMAPAAVSRLTASGQDMYYLQNLIEKLSLLNQGKEIGWPDLAQHLDSKQTINVFKLTDSLLNRNVKASLAAFYQLQEQGQHHLLLLHMITRQYVSLAKIKHYQELGYNASKIAELSRQKEYTVRKLMEKSNSFNYREIRFIFERLLATDTSFKSESKDPKILMESLLVQLCNK